MAKVHPNAPVVPEPAAVRATAAVVVEEEVQQPTVLTVWRKSLLFNCDGFTVFDAAGDLAFRVDCYGSSGRRRRHAEDVVLMDAAGKPLLTVRRKIKLNLAEHWVVYDGDASGATAAATKPLLSVRRHHVGGLRRRRSSDKALALVTPLASSGSESYVVEGSYGRRSCAVRDARGNAVVEVRRKESVGDDVFRLVVADPRGLGAPLAMGIVIALDEMFGCGGSAATGASARSLLPRSWSA